MGGCDVGYRNGRVKSGRVRPRRRRVAGGSRPRRSVAVLVGGWRTSSSGGGRPRRGFLGLQVALTGLLLANAVPDRRVAEQLRDAGRDGDLPAADYPRSSYGSRVDGFTDCLGLSSASRQRRAVIRRRRADDPCVSGCAPTNAWARPGESPPPAAEKQYLRMWNGYVVLTRPGVALLGVATTRLLSRCCARWLAVAGVRGAPARAVAIGFRDGPQAGLDGSVRSRPTCRCVSRKPTRQGCVTHLFGTIRARQAVVAANWLGRVGDDSGTTSAQRRPG